VLDPHGARLERIRADHAWISATGTSSHNDPVPRNILFDGVRLWLIDWESACRNHPLVDVAILLDNLAPTAGLAHLPPGMAGPGADASAPACPRPR
jgi:hypothetical protein